MVSRLPLWLRRRWFLLKSELAFSSSLSRFGAWQKMLGTLVTSHHLQEHILMVHLIPKAWPSEPPGEVRAKRPCQADLASATPHLSPLHSRDPHQRPLWATLVFPAWPPWQRLLLPKTCRAVIFCDRVQVATLSLPPAWFPSTTYCTHRPLDEV